MKAFPVVVLVMLALTGCTAGSDNDRLAGRETEQIANQAARPDRLPVPVLKVGEPYTADLEGDGQATITVTATEMSKLDGHGDRLVVTVDIRLNKAGKPITGGPENFRFRDKDSAMHKAQTDEQAFPPQLPSISFTSAGQSVRGRIYFDVPAGNAEGGHIQLMTGALVHAVWAL